MFQKATSKDSKKRKYESVTNTDNLDEIDGEEAKYLLRRVLEEMAELKQKLRIAEQRQIEQQNRSNFSWMTEDWTKVKAKLKSSFDSGKLKTDIHYRHPIECARFAELIMCKIIESEIPKILGEVDETRTKEKQEEKGLQQCLNKIGKIIEQLFNDVSNETNQQSDVKLPKIQFVSNDEALHSNGHLHYPDGRFCPPHDTLISPCSNQFLVMIELKSYLVSREKPNHPWKMRTTSAERKPIGTSSRGSAAVMQSLQRSYRYFSEPKNIYNTVSNMITDLHDAYFLQPASNNFYTANPSSDDLEGCFTFAQLLMQKQVDSSQANDKNSTDPERTFPAIETLVKLIIDASLSSIKTEKEPIDSYMKDLDVISILTGAVGDIAGSCIGAASTNQTKLRLNQTGAEIKFEPITLTKDDGTTSTFEAIHKLAEKDDETTVMAVRRGGSQMCLKMETSYISHKYGRLENEANVLTELQHLNGIPKLIFRGTINNYRNQSWFAVVTEPIGVPFNLLPSSFFSSATLAIGLWNLMRQILIDIHASGFLHCDIKPPNMILNVDGPYIIDYDGAIPNPKLRVAEWEHFLFSERWASRNVIEGEYPSIQSDHVSLFFSFLDLISNGRLVDLGSCEPSEIPVRILSVLDKSFHHWANELISIFSLTRELGPIEND